MDLLGQHGIDRIFHFAPLHYLPFIARDQRLRSKPELAKEGFTSTHYRSTSAHLDAERGFGNYVHLSTHPEPPILAAKLKSGFPHVGLELLTDDYSGHHYDLCRFNIAKTRYLRRAGKPGFPENDANGRYYGSLQIPIARSDDEKEHLLSRRQGDPMIEVLVDSELKLGGAVRVRTYSEIDKVLAMEVIHHFGMDWEVHLCESHCSYNRSHAYGASVGSFIATALSDPGWRGNGLEFDRL